MTRLPPHASSERSPWPLSVVAASLGGATSLYLLWLHQSLDLSPETCGASGCADVLRSDYAHVGGIPLPWLGLAFFFAFGVSSLWANHAAWLRRVNHLLAGLGALTAIGLLGVQAFVLGAFCPFCLVVEASAFVGAAAVVLGWPRAPLPPHDWRVGLSLAALIVPSLAWLAAERLDPVVAEVEGAVLRQSDMQRGLEFELYTLDEKRYQLQRSWLQRRLFDALIEREAERTQQPEPEVMRQLVDVPFQAAVAGEQEAFRSLPPAQRSRARTLWERSERQRHEGLALAKLRESWSVRVDLPRPRSPRLTLDASLAHRLGAQEPRVTLTAFTDLRCPHCRDLWETLEALLARFPALAVDLRAYPIELISGREGFDGAVALASAARQGQLQAYASRLYRDPQPLTPRRLADHASSLGLDSGRFASDCASPDLRRKVEASKRDARSLGVKAVPSLFLDGVYLQGSLDRETLEQRLRVLLDEDA